MSLPRNLFTVQKSGRTKDGRRRNISGENRRESSHRLVRVVSTHGKGGILRVQQFDRRNKKQFSSTSNVYKKYLVKLFMLFDRFNELFIGGILTDICIRTYDRQQMHAHKIILAVNSEYFYHKLTNKSNSELNSSDCILIDDQKVQFHNLHKVICYFYTKQLDAEEDVQGILYVSELLKVNEVSEICHLQMLKSLSPDDFLSTWNFISSNMDTFWEKRLIGKLGVMMNNVVSSTDFICLTPKQIQSLLNVSVKKNTCNISVLLTGILRWIGFAPADRKKYIPELLSYIDCSCLPYPFLARKLFNDEMLLTTYPDIAKCLLRSICSKHNPKHEYFILCHVIPPNIISILCRSVHETTGKLKQWTINEIPKFRRNVMCSYGNCLYIVTFKTIFVLDLDMKEWISLHYECDYCKSTNSIVGSADGSLFIIRDQQVKMFNLPESFTGWEAIAPIPIKLKNAIVVTVDDILHIIDTDFVIQYLDRSIHNWQIVSRNQMIAGCNFNDLTPFESSASSKHAIYLYRCSTNALFKISLPDYDISYHVLPSRCVEYPIRCMSVTITKDCCGELPKFTVKMVEYNGLVLSYSEDDNCWSQDFVYKEPHSSATWEKMNYKDERRNELLCFPEFTVDFGLVASMRT